MKTDWEFGLFIERLNDSFECGNSYNAIPGDIVKIIKGRKFKKGTRFVILNEELCKDKYNRVVAKYWRTTSGKKVLQHNCIIVDNILFRKEK